MTKKLPYPDLPDSDHKLFWLAAFLRSTAELDAVHRLKKREARLPVTPAYSALCTAERAVLELLHEAATYCVHNGLLPMAFTGTTALKGATA